MLLAGVKVVDVRAVTALASHGARLIDTRAIHDFLAGHLPQAQHVDYKERSIRDAGFDANDDDVPTFLRRLRKFTNADRPVIFYCNGPACWKSYKAAVAARKAGYRDVYWFRGGVSEWKQEGKPLIGE